MLERSLAFMRENIVLTAVQHAVGGFGLAIVLQVYLQGDAFAPLWLGWIMVAFSVALHVYEAALAVSTRSTNTTKTTERRIYSN